MLHVAFAVRFHDDDGIGMVSETYKHSIEKHVTLSCVIVIETKKIS